MLRDAAGLVSNRRGRKSSTGKSPTFIARVRVHMNGETAGPVEAFGAVRTGMSSPAVRLLVGGDRG
jgi:hypothetical protein